MIILAPKILIYHFISPSFKFTLQIIVVLCIRTDHSICCRFAYIMARRELVRATRPPSNSCGGDEDGPKFIRCVDRRQPKFHEVWTFGEDGVTREV